MKNYGIILLLASIVFTSFGSIRKITHTFLGDGFLLLGMVTAVIAVILILLQVFKKRSH